jgi:RNA-binding protein YhbY
MAQTGKLFNKICQTEAETISKIGILVVLRRWTNRRKNAKEILPFDYLLF